MTMELVPVTSQNRIPFILTGKADLVMATLTITPQRAEQILFSKPYCAQESIIMAPHDTEITLLRRPEAASACPWCAAPSRIR